MHIIVSVILCLYSLLKHIIKINKIHKKSPVFAEVRLSVSRKRLGHAIISAVQVTLLSSGHVTKLNWPINLASS